MRLIDHDLDCSAPVQVVRIGGLATKTHNSEKSLQLQFDDIRVFKPDDLVAEYSVSVV